WKVPVGSETRARHIGCPSVPTFSTSVITPTTKTRFTFAPSGVTMYEGGRSPVPSASKFASLYSEAKSRQATSRITRTPPGLRASHSRGGRALPSPRHGVGTRPFAGLAGIRGNDRRGPNLLGDQSGSRARSRRPHPHVRRGPQSTSVG